jgi:hypothetical protein
LLSVVKSNSNSQGSNTKHALLMTTYSALFFFLSAAFSGLVLTNVFGEVAARAIQRGSGSKRSWVWATRHCEFRAHNTGLSSSPPDRRYDLPDRGHLIRNLAAALVRLAGRVYLCQKAHSPSSWRSPCYSWTTSYDFCYETD